MSLITLVLALMVTLSQAAPLEKVFVATAGLWEPEQMSKAQTPLDKRGMATWYDPSDPRQNEGYVNQGSCGYIDSSRWIVAWNPGYCGQKIGLRAFGKCTEATVMDRCSSCGGDHVDMTPALFQYFTGLGTGQFNLEILTGGCGYSAPQASVASAPAPSGQQCSASDWGQCPQSGCCFNGQCAAHEVCFGNGGATCSASTWDQCPSSGCCINGQCRGSHAECFGW